MLSALPLFLPSSCPLWSSFVSSLVPVLGRNRVDGGSGGNISLFGCGHSGSSNGGENSRSGGRRRRQPRRRVGTLDWLQPNASNSVSRIEWTADPSYILNDSSLLPYKIMHRLGSEARTPCAACFVAPAVACGPTALAWFRLAGTLVSQKVVSESFSEQFHCTNSNLFGV